MIKSLEVKNFAIIEDLTINYNEGMTALTGETGAGKSLIIDTINLLLGDRADSQMIRYGMEESYIKGIFSHNNELDDLFNNYNISINNDIIIERIITKTKSNIKINNTNINLSLLKQISPFIASIHTQNDNFKIYNQNTYLELLDPINDSKFEKLINNYNLSLYNYLNNYKTYETILKGINETKEKIEFLEYEYNEISLLNLEEDIDKKLEEEISILENGDKIINSLNSAYESLNGNISAIDSIYDAYTSLSKISEYKEEYEKMKNDLLETYYIQDEIRHQLNKEINNIDFDEDELNVKIEKLNDINNIKNKYKKTVKELIEYQNKIKLDIDMVNNYDETLNESKNGLINSFNLLKENSLKLREYRINLAKILEKDIVKEAIDLDLENTQFKIEFNEINLDDPFNKSIFNDNGIDTIDFLVSFNKGEPVKPLLKVVSGGEASRLMLAFRSIFSKKAKSNLMIFDEIDTGVSGVVAKKIAKKMHDISKYNQVLAITHLPQVAAIADNNIYIYKENKNDRTYTNIEYLSDTRKIEEIASMISGDKLSINALNNAKELIKNIK